MKNLLLHSVVLFLLGLFTLSSCEKSSDISYPHEEHETLYLGFKSGLTFSSSEQDFEEGLKEVMQKYADDNAGAADEEYIFDGVRYGITNLQAITGGVPNNIWDLYSKDMEKYNYSIGSCWGFSHLRIPSKGATGIVYVLYTIVTNNNGEIRYIALRGNVSPR